MTIRIVVNGNEVTNPFAKALLVFGAIIIAALVAALVIFVLFPIIGIAVTLSVGFIVICIVATIVGITTLAFGAAILGLLFGATEFRVENTRKRK